MTRIWTLNARDNVLLEVVSREFGLSDAAQQHEIIEAHARLGAILASKGIGYETLRSALTPSSDRAELALLFDAGATGEGWYGYPIAEAVITRLPRKNFNCSLLSGDLIAPRDDQDHAFALLERSLRVHRQPRAFRYTNELYAIYINNLSRARADALIKDLRTYDPFVGYVDCSFGSPTKDWFSITLSTSYVKHGTTFVGMSEDDLNDEENENTLGWPVDRGGLRCVSVPSLLFSLFLDYKIERRVIAGESDTASSLVAMSGRSHDLRTIPIEIPADKIDYLKERHAGPNFQASGLGSISQEQFVAQVEQRIARSYIYDMHSKSHPSGTSNLFALMLEFPNTDPLKEPVRLKAAFEYFPARPALKLITLV